MAHRIEVKHKDNFTDGREKSLLKVIHDDTGLELDEVKIINIFNLFGDYSLDELKHLKDDLFCDPVFQESETGFFYAKKLEYDFCIEVSYLDGVTDNVGRTAGKGISNILKRRIDENDVGSSTMYFFRGSITDTEIRKIAEKILCNTLIEKFFIFNKDQAVNGFEVSYSKKEEFATVEPYYDTINLEIGDEELTKISDDFVLSLSLEEMHAIRDFYRREEVIEYRNKRGLPAGPTNVELEVFAQTWSEHCKHKIFAGRIRYNDDGKKSVIDSLFKTFIKGSTGIIGKNRHDLLSVFIDNAGIVKFNDEYAYCVKVETHNSPSALDPYGGAMTGIVGVNRDIIGTGMGAYPIFNTDVFCFGSPFIEESAIPKELLHPRRIFRGVHRGIRDGGNESGIPTVNGSIVFDGAFIGKPLVFCGTGGIMPLKIEERESHKKYTQPGDLIVMCGGRIGKDGIHGATFSSAHLTESSPTSAVQIGDPITQKKLLDFLMEARDLGLYNGLTDNGAGGLSSSVGEMATITGGALLELNKCPLKYSGLKPWEILLSEAQERMTVAVPKDRIERFLELSRRRDVESTVIGEFNTSGYFDCKFNDKIVASIEMEMLHEGVPGLDLEAEWKSPGEERLKELNKDYKEALRMLLKSPNIASKEYWVRIYDHEVGARTIGKPFSGVENDGPSDGAVLKIFPNSFEGLVVTHGIVPRYSKIDTYQMAANAIDEAYRHAVILGANPDMITGLDNFCWPDPVESEHTPDGKFKLAQLIRACQAVYDVTIAYNCPCISGKDSMKNDFRSDGKKISVLPTLLFTVVGKMDDIRLSTSFYFKEEGSLIYLLGNTRPELGASEYYSIHNVSGGIVPKVEPLKSLELYRKIYSGILKSLFLSLHDLSDGGLAVSLVECAFSGNLGAEVNIASIGNELTAEEKLFSESPSRILVSIKKEREAEFIELFKGFDIFFLGKTTRDQKINIFENENRIIHDDLKELKSIWKNALIF